LPGDRAWQGVVRSGHRDGERRWTAEALSLSCSRQGTDPGPLTFPR
jgi:hypothetical protein